MIKQLLFLLLLVGGCSSAEPAIVDTNIGSPVSQDVVRKALAKGVNLENWFNDYSDAKQYGTRFTSADLARIKAQGFTHIRLPIGTNVLYQNENPSQLQPNKLTFVDAAVKMAIDAGLAVVFDPIHNADETFEKNLATIAGVDAKVADYWKAVATYFSKYPTDKIFFEVYNEPHVGTAKYGGLTSSWWWPMQLKFVKAIRQVTANHYIIVGAEGWNGKGNLLSITSPYSEQNIIYNFHIYDPFLFTHQGASWAGWEPAVTARAVPYPPKQSVIDSLINATTVQSLKEALTWYGSQKYNADSLKNWIKPVDAWAKKFNLVVTCNEFGSYKLYPTHASRLAWIRDMRLALELNNIGWTMWEYDSGFGLTTYTNNDRSQPITDDGVLVSLGLK